MLGTRYYTKAVKVLSVLQSHERGITTGGIATVLTKDGIDEENIKEILRVAMEQGLAQVCKEHGGFVFYSLTTRMKV